MAGTDAEAGTGADGAALDDEWIAGLVAASEDLELPGGRSTTVAITIGKTRQAVLEIADGRVVGPGDEAAIAVTVPTTAEQLTAFADGSVSMARAYMEGDVKPVGSTGALLALIELYETPEFRARLSA